MRSMLLAAVAVFTALVAAVPNPEPIDYLMSIDSTAYGLPYEDDPNLKRSVRIFTRAHLKKRQESPDNTCGGMNEYLCLGFDVDGPCCGALDTCGQGVDHCAGGCQPEFGHCIEPVLQLQMDAENGDVIWDPVTDNVFDAEVGDGMIYYGSTPSGGWPA